MNNLINNFINKNNLINMNNLINKNNLKKILYGGGKSSLILIGVFVVFVFCCFLIGMFYFISKSKKKASAETPTETTTETPAETPTETPGIKPIETQIETITTINYNLLDTLNNNVTYNDGNIIGGNLAFASTSSEWDNNKGIFTASSDGFYLINASFFINGKTPGTRITLMVNNKLRYVIIEDNPNIITSETLRTYSRVEQLSKGDTLIFKGGNGFTVFFGNENFSHSNISITKLNINASNYYYLIENAVYTVGYNDDENIGSKSALISPSSEWDKDKGIFTASSDGFYLINASFFITGKSGGNRISLMVNKKLRYVIIEGNGISGATFRTYSRVEQLSKGDTLTFKGANGFIMFFNDDNSSHSNFTITKLNIDIKNYYYLIENGPNNFNYNNGDNIGSKSTLISTSTEWDSVKGIFTASSDGIYLINVSFFINGKTPGNRISLMVNNKSRYCVIEGSAISSETLRTYSRVEQLVKGDTLSFKVTVGDGFTIFVADDNSSHSNFTITKLN